MGEIVQGAACECGEPGLALVVQVAVVQAGVEGLVVAGEQEVEVPAVERPEARP